VISDDLSDTNSNSVVFASHNDSANTIQVRSNSVNGSGASTGAISLSGFNSLSIGSSDDSTPAYGDGNFYGGIAVNRLLTAGEITNTETYLGTRTGFYAPVITGLPTIGVS
jgi:hypothetical protein